MAHYNGLYYRTTNASFQPPPKLLYGKLPHHFLDRERGVASMTTIVTCSFTWPLTFSLALVKHVLPNEHPIDSAHVTQANVRFTLFLVFCLHLSRLFQFMSIPIQYIQAEAVPTQESKSQWFTSVQARVVSGISSLSWLYLFRWIRVSLLFFKAHCSDILGGFIQWCVLASTYVLIAVCAADVLCAY